MDEIAEATVDPTTAVLPSLRFRIGLYFLFFACALLIFAISYFTPDFSVGTVALPPIFLIIAIFLHRHVSLSKYWSIFYAFFVFSIVLYSRHLVLDSSLFHDFHSTINGITIIQIVDSVVVIAPIILLTKASRGTMDSLFLKRGNLRLGLIVGLPVFIALFFVSVVVTQIVGGSYGARGISFGYLFSLTPYILALSLSNGVKDELWFRGLFFKKYQPLIGPRLSNLLQAPIFALNGLGAEYQPILIIFAVVTILLALGVGYLMQKTDSVIGSSLIQAGADTPIFLILILTSVH